LLAKHTGQPLKRIQKDTDRDHFLSGEEAVEYGLIDTVLVQRGDTETASEATV
jgi:ATP-dependent Clp protease protease subunit